METPTKVKTSTVNRITIDNKKKDIQKEVPAGATILSNDTDIRVEAIENGFIINKETNIRYSTKTGSTEYAYITKKYYSAVDPLEITSKDKSLADLFK